MKFENIRFFEVGAKLVRLRNYEFTSHLRIPTLNRSLRTFLRRFLFRSEVGTASEKRIEFGPKVIFEVGAKSVRLRTNFARTEFGPRVISEFAATPQRLRPEGGIRLRSDVDPISDQNFKPIRINRIGVMCSTPVSKFG